MAATLYIWWYEKPGSKPSRVYATSKLISKGRLNAKNGMRAWRKVDKKQSSLLPGQSWHGVSAYGVPWLACWVEETP